MKDDTSNPRAQTVVFLGLGGIIVIIIALIRGKLQLFIPFSLSFNFLLLVLMSTPAYLLVYRAYQLIGASEVALFLATGKLWNVLGAFLFLHEALTLQKVLGAIIILLGIAIVLYDKRRFAFNKGVIFVLLAAFLFGMTDINGFYILRTLDATNYLIYAEFLPVIALLLIQPTILKKVQYYFHKDKAVKVFLLSLGDALGSLAFIFAFQAGGKASVIGPLSATRVLVTTGLAILILKERGNIMNKLIGAVVTVVGVILLL
jgi:uncharacterized membrane protein